MSPVYIVQFNCCSFLFLVTQFKGICGQPYPRILVSAVIRKKEKQNNGTKKLYETGLVFLHKQNSFTKLKRGDPKTRL